MLRFQNIINIGGISELIQIILSPPLIMLIIFLIMNRIITTANHSRRAMINLIVGFLLTAIFVIAYIVDVMILKMYTLEIGYYLFALSAAIFTLAFSIRNFIKGKRNFHTISKMGSYKQPPSERTVAMKINNYVYVLYKYDTTIYLIKHKEYYKGIEFKLSGNNMFKDEAILKLNATYGANVKEDGINEIGKLIVDKKVPDMYYCYLIDLHEALPQNEKLERFEQIKVASLPYEKIDQQLVLRTLIREKFNIKL